MNRADEITHAASVVHDRVDREPIVQVVPASRVIADHLAKSGEWVPPIVLTTVDAKRVALCEIGRVEDLVASAQAKGFEYAGVEIEGGLPARFVFEPEATDPRN